MWQRAFTLGTNKLDYGLTLIWKGINIRLGSALFG